MADFHDRIEQTNQETRQRIQVLSDSALVNIQRNPDQHSQQEISFATEELEKRYPTPKVTVRPKPPSTYWIDGCIVWATFLTLGVVIGGFLGFGAGVWWLSAQGWTGAWLPVNPPPDTPTNIIAISDQSLWIKTNDGVFYYNEDAIDCESDCWQQVDSMPSEPEPPRDTLEHKPHACVWIAPFLDAKIIKDECNRGPWLDTSTAYALRSDGELFVWRYISGGEWVFLDLVKDTFIGVILGPIIVIALGRRRNSSTPN